MEELRNDVRRIFAESVSTEYTKIILDKIEDDIVSDVVETSAYEEDGSYNDDDIRLAIGRVLINKMGIMY